MPITIVQTDPTPNRPGNINEKQKKAAQEVIAQLTYTDPWRGRGTLRKNDLMRVDMQGIIAGEPPQRNLQVQINGVSGSSTVAHANVSESIMTDDPANQLGAIRKVMSALNQSLASGYSYDVAGAIP